MAACYKKLAGSRGGCPGGFQSVVHMGCKPLF